MTVSPVRSPELAEVHVALAATRFEAVVAAATPVFLAARDAARWALASEAALLLGRAHANLPQPVEAMRWLREATQAARLAEDPEAEALAWLQLAAEHARYEQVAPALQALEEAGRLAAQVRQHERLYPLLSNSAATTYGLGLYQLALGTSRRALDAAERLDDLAQRLTARTNLLLVGSSAHEQLAAADEAAAAALVQELRGHLAPLEAEVQQVGTPRALARAHMVVARVFMASGEWSRAQGRLAQLLEMAVELPPVLWCSAWLAQARVLSEQGDTAGARAAAQRAEQHAQAPRPDEPRTYDLRRRAEIAELLGRPKEALALYRRYHERAQHVLAAAFEARLAEFLARIDQQELLMENSALREQNAALGAGLQNLSRLATTDPLTGLLNRRGLDAELAALRLTGQACVLALVDVDHFKRINDTHSHAIGDRVLAALARCMAQALRDGDRLARIGGEEFAVVLPRAEAAQAAIGLERLREAVEQHDWSSVLPGLAVTVSVGLAEATTGTAFEAVLAEADARLYRAKAAGRNRVVANAADGCP